MIHRATSLLISYIVDLRLLRYELIEDDVIDDFSI